MSYSFSAKAATKQALKDAAHSEFDSVVAGQPIHAKDRNAAQVATNAFIDMIADDDSQDISVSVSGWLSYKHDDSMTSANVAITTGLTPRAVS